MTHPRSDPAIPDPTERAKRNAALHTDNIETGFFDKNGHPAPWPDDIHQWQPETGEPSTGQPGDQPF
jgi:hypothetical protein